MQATVVALYGAKPQGLCQLLTHMQFAVRQLVGASFRGYDMEQIHATLIGLERDESHLDQYLNRNFRDFRCATIEMDFGGLIEYLRCIFSSPIKIQIGGFQNREYSFSSRGKRPFERGFSIQGRNVLSVGWPCRDQSSLERDTLHANAGSCPTDFPDSLHLLRKTAERFGVLHAYHRRPGDADNDLYFRIGILDDPRALDPAMQARVEHAMRQMLSLRAPLLVDIDTSNVSIGFYESAELPLQSTASYPLHNDRLDQVLIRRGYGAPTR